MQSLGLAKACIIIDKALEKGREMTLAPLTVAVLDAGGQLMARSEKMARAFYAHRLLLGKHGEFWEWGLEAGSWLVGLLKCLHF